MAQSNAERQRAYRQRHLKDIEGGGERLNTVVSVSAKAQLARLAQYHGTSQRETLERLIGAAEAGIVRQLKSTTQYYGDVTA